MTQDLIFFLHHPLNRIRDEKKKILQWFFKFLFFFYSAWIWMHMMFLFVYARVCENIPQMKIIQAECSAEGNNRY